MRSWILAFVLCLAGNCLGAGSSRDPKVAEAYLPVLRQLAAEEGLVREVQARDAHPISDSQAQKIQKTWADIGISDLERPYLFNGASEAIRAYESRVPPMFKCFVLDQQGNVVGTAPECKDFMHGRMPKFLKCYNGGQGRVYLNPPGLDISTQIYSVQASVPVVLKNRTLGVLVATLSLE
ncbi:MAG TPA: PDC sensor domain-containing protein [bacterium]|nr:PDC sensor domain-containing protein [bacterium]